MSSLPLFETLVAVSPYPAQQQQIGTRRRALTLASHAAAPRNNNKNLGASYGFSNLSLSSTRTRFKKNGTIISCTTGMMEGDSAKPKGIDLDHIRDKVKTFSESLPQPVRSFPWADALENFLELILNLVYEVGKYLCAPVLALTTLSELSYCAHERKMRLVPIPLLAGIAMAGVLRDTILELYPQIKEGEFPWHVVGVAILFVLLKLPGPYYPYWGRILVPHFANGGLLRCLWFCIMWYRRDPEIKTPQIATNDQSLDLSSKTDDAREE